MLAASRRLVAFRRLFPLLYPIVSCSLGAIVRIVKGNGQFIVNGRDVRLVDLPSSGRIGGSTKQHAVCGFCF